MNIIIFILSVLNAGFLPAILLTTDYGMNFATPGGDPTIPELKWSSGYHYFWGFSVTLSLGCPLCLVVTLQYISSFKAVHSLRKWLVSSSVFGVGLLLITAFGAVGGTFTS